MSAVSFESSYARYTRTIEPGVPNTALQAHSAIFTYQRACRHYCQNHILYKAKQPTHRTRKRANYLIYTFTCGQRAGRGHRFWRIERLQGAFYLCRELLANPWRCPMTKYDFSRVGVYRYTELSARTERIHGCYIRGKAMKVDGFVVSCPANILRDR